MKKRREFEFWYDPQDKKQIRARIQERDWLVQTRLWQFGYLTLEQIAEHVMCTSVGAARRRLNKLYRSAFIEREVLRDKERTRVFIPNVDPNEDREDFGIVEAGEKTLWFKPWDRKPTLHDQLAKEIGLRALRIFPEMFLLLDYALGSDKWNIEENYWSDRKKVPDFVLGTLDENYVSFEIETTGKGSSRYSGIFKFLVTQPNRPTVYLVLSQTLKDKLQSIYSEVLQDPLILRRGARSRVFFRTFSEVITNDDLKKVIAEAFLSLKDVPLPLPKQEGQADIHPIRRNLSDLID